MIQSEKQTPPSRPFYPIPSASLSKKSPRAPPKAYLAPGPRPIYIRAT